MNILGQNQGVLGITESRSASSKLREHRKISSDDTAIRKNHRVYRKMPPNILIRQFIYEI
jgi:hypothetical protein